MQRVPIKSGGIKRRTRTDARETPNPGSAGTDRSATPTNSRNHPSSTDTSTASGVGTGPFALLTARWEKLRPYLWLPLGGPLVMTGFLGAILVGIAGHP